MKQQLREEKRKAEKLIQNLEIQRGADLAAQQAIRDLQQRLTQAQQVAATAAFTPSASFSMGHGVVVGSLPATSNADAMLLARSLGVASSSLGAASGHLHLPTAAAASSGAAGGGAVGGGRTHSFAGAGGTVSRQATASSLGFASSAEPVAAPGTGAGGGIAARGGLSGGSHLPPRPGATAPSGIAAALAAAAPASAASSRAPQ